MLSDDIKYLGDAASFYVEQGGLPDLNYLAEMVRLLRGMQQQAAALEAAQVDVLLTQPEVGVDNGGNVIRLDEHRRNRTETDWKGGAA